MMAVTFMMRQSGVVGNAPMGVESGGGGRRGHVPSSEKIRMGRPPRFENEVAQIWCLFPFLGYFGGRLAMPADDSSPSQKSVASPLRAPSETDANQMLHMK